MKKARKRERVILENVAADVILRGHRREAVAKAHALFIFYQGFVAVILEPSGLLVGLRFRVQPSTLQTMRARSMLMIVRL